MPTLQEVKQQIKNYGDAYIFWTQREIKALPEILDDNETIKAITSGITNSTTWLAVCTERRLIFLNHNMLIGVEQIQMPLDRIQSIDHAFTLFFGSIRVYDGINMFNLGMVLKSAILPFVKATEMALHATRHPAAAAASKNAPDIASQLSKLVDLKEKGYLTSEEFEAQKKKLLSA